MTIPDGDGWPEWRRHVLAELKRANDEREQERNEIATLRTEMANAWSKVSIEISALKVKAGLWGAVAGVVVVIGTLLVGLLR